MNNTFAHLSLAALTAATIALPAAAADPAASGTMPKCSAHQEMMMKCGANHKMMKCGAHKKAKHKDAMKCAPKCGAKCGAKGAAKCGAKCGAKEASK